MQAVLQIDVQVYNQHAMAGEVLEWPRGRDKQPANQYACITLGLSSAERTRSSAHPSDSHPFDDSAAAGHSPCNVQPHVIESNRAALTAILAARELNLGARLYLLANCAAFHPR